MNWIANGKSVKHEDLTDTAISQFLGKYAIAKLDNSQQLDLKGMIGRGLSASYTPLPGEPMHAEFVKRATYLFNRYQLNDAVTLEYWTEVYAGQLTWAWRTGV